MAPDQCEIRVVGVEDYRTRADGIDVGYRVRGKAGSPATAWLAARSASGTYVAGYGVNVGPGPFEAIIDLKLTGMPERFLALLEVAGNRCKDNAPLP
jgi:hypothetical protein